VGVDKTGARVHLEARGVGKHFGGVQALRDVSLAIERGTIHALVGENGAGKSTFGKIVAGFYSPDLGQLVLNGQPVKFRSPRDALRAGITIVGQERNVVPQRSVLDNVFLGRENNAGGFIDRRVMRSRYAALAESVGFDLPAEARVGRLRVSEQLQVEILRALVRDARLLVMDEVTAALTTKESERLFAVMRALREEGRTLLYISHFLGEVLALADTVSVLRDGSLIRTAAATDETPESLVSAMLGHVVQLGFPEKTPPPPDSPVVLSVRNLSRGDAVKNVLFDLRAGEILGVAGLTGAGRTETARLIFGADRRDGGEIEVEGRRVDMRQPWDGIKAGIALLPASRKEEGLFMRQSITRNVSVVHVSKLSRLGVLRRGLERQQVGELTSRLDVRMSGLRALAETLSGGNQQKLLFSKWLFRPPRVLIADEPTQGVDVGAKHAIYALIARLAAQGLAVLLISSELEEVLGLSHRVLVMREGRLVAEFSGEQASAENVMRSAFGAATAPGGEAA
jgi:simple sugar transport system ATP-binding protein/ribose transport system ATP-binding protein